MALLKLKNVRYTEGNIPYMEGGHTYIPPAMMSITVGSIGSDGVVNLPGASGQVAVTEDDAAATLTKIGQIANQFSAPTIGGTFVGESEAWRGKRKAATAAIALAGGSVAGFGLVAAVAGYYACMELTGIMSDTADTYTFDFEDEDGTDAQMISQADFIVAAPDVSYPIYGMILHVAADGKALEVDVTGGADVEIIYLSFEFWHET